VERKAGLEDLLPILGKNRWTLQYIIKECKNTKIYLASALAFLPGEIKEIVYSNMSPRVADRLKKRVRSMETGNRYHKRYHKSYAMQHKEKLIDLIGKYENTEPLWIEFPECIVFKNAEPEEMQELEPSLTALEAFTKKFEEALDSGCLDIAYIGQYMTHKEMRTVMDTQRIFTALSFDWQHKNRVPPGVDWRLQVPDRAFACN